jgi:hypothetical protein
MVRSSISSFYRCSAALRSVISCTTHDVEAISGVTDEERKKPDHTAIPAMDVSTE